MPSDKTCALKLMICKNMMKINFFHANWKYQKIAATRYKIAAAHYKIPAARYKIAAALQKITKHYHEGL